MNHIDIFQNHFMGVFPETFFVTAITIILLYTLSLTTHRTMERACARGQRIIEAHRERPLRSRRIFSSREVRVIGWLAIWSLVLLTALSAYQPAMGVILGDALIIDDLTITVRTIILLSALASLAISFGYIESQRICSYEYIILILFSTFSALLITSSHDLISMYLGIELQTLCFYVLAAFRRNDELSVEAGLKYFILGALSSGLLLFGASIIYGATGITSFEELTKLLGHFSHQEALLAMPYGGFGGLILLVAFLFKIGAVPFHMWTPDVYEGAPTSVTAFFAITPKIAILSLLLRLTQCTFPQVAYGSWEQIYQSIMVCSLLSMLIGTFGAIAQIRVKRLFAYSSIAHVGYLLIALATGTIEAAESLLLYIIVYMFMVINVFGVLLALSCHKGHNMPSPVPYMWSGAFGNLGKGLGSTPSAIPSGASPFCLRQGRGAHIIEYITDLCLLSKSAGGNPVLAFTTAAILFSNAGIPPLAGFYGKLNVFSAAIEAKMYFLAIAGVICATMGAFYSIRLVKIIYYHKTPFGAGKRVHLFKQVSKESSIILASTFFFTVFFFMNPSFLFILTHSAALSLCA